MYHNVQCWVIRCWRAPWLITQFGCQVIDGLSNELKCYKSSSLCHDSRSIFSCRRRIYFLQEVSSDWWRLLIRQWNWIPIPNGLWSATQMKRAAWRTTSRRPSLRLRCATSVASYTQEGHATSSTSTSSMSAHTRSSSSSPGARTARVEKDWTRTRRHYAWRPISAFFTSMTVLPY
jgi:hypothetical protein